MKKYNKVIIYKINSFTIMYMCLILINSVVSMNSTLNIQSSEMDNILKLHFHMPFTHWGILILVNIESHRFSLDFCAISGE